MVADAPGLPPVVAGADELAVARPLTGFTTVLPQAARSRISTALIAVITARCRFRANMKITSVSRRDLTQSPRFIMPRGVEKGTSRKAFMGEAIGPGWNMVPEWPLAMRGYRPLGRRWLRWTRCRAGPAPVPRASGQRARRPSWPARGRQLPPPGTARPAASSITPAALPPFHAAGASRRPHLDGRRGATCEAGRPGKRRPAASAPLRPGLAACGRNAGRTGTGWRWGG